MGVLIRKFTSRKFWFAIGGYISAIVLMALHAITPEVGMRAILNISIAYLGAEGAGDVAERLGIRQLLEGLFSQKLKKASK